MSRQEEKGAQLQTGVWWAGFRRLKVCCWLVMVLLPLSLWDLLREQFSQQRRFAENVFVWGILLSPLIPTRYLDQIPSRSGILS